MTPNRNHLRGLFLLWAWLMLGPGAWGYTHAQLGTLVPDAEMPTLAGGKQHLLSDAAANIIVYFRPKQDYSVLGLKELSTVEKEFTGKPVHWVAVVSDRAAKADVEAEVKASGISMPVLVDVGDALYGQLGVAQTPVAIICDEQHRLVDYQPFRKVNYGAVVRARLRYQLKEISDKQLAEALNPPATVNDTEQAASSRRLKLAAMLFKVKSYEKALENVEISIQESPSAEAYDLRGEILIAQGKCAEATLAFNEALKLEPQNTRALAGIKGCHDQQ